MNREDTAISADLPKLETDDAVKKLVQEIASGADLELLNCPPITSTAFIHQDPCRVFRIQSDVTQGIEMITRALLGAEHSIAVLGSARMNKTPRALTD